MSRAFTFDFEDVFAACDDRLEVVSIKVPTANLQRKAWRATQTLRHATGGSPKTQDELVFAVAQVVGDLPDHFPFLPVIRAASKSACFVEELWIRELPLKLDVRRFLAEFDHVFVSCAATVEPLAAHLQRPVSYLAPSVDHLRFASSPWPSASVDVYAMGRRLPSLHDAIQQWASVNDRFYLFDTFVGNVPIEDHRLHRSKLADIIRRSTYFVVNGAKVNSPGETGNQVEVGYRFFEGAASGSVMIGTTPDVPTFKQLFDWPEPVVEVDPAGVDLVERLEEIELEAERRAAIRERNVKGSLRKHDAAHRWRTVLRCLDLDEPVALANRIEMLANEADVIALR